MGRSRILVVYYSRTGTTATVARAIADATGADLEPLVDTVDRRGALGFLRSLVDAIVKRRTTLAPLRLDPTAYDLLVVGTPVWGQSVSAPVRAFFEEHRECPPAIAFFLTDGQSSHDDVFRDMASLAGREPIARLGLPHEDVVQGRYADRVAAFVRRLPATGPVAPPAAR